MSFHSILFIKLQRTEMIASIHHNQFEIQCEYINSTINIYTKSLCIKFINLLCEGNAQL